MTNLCDRDTYVAAPQCVLDEIRSDVMRWTKTVSHLGLHYSASTNAVIEYRLNLLGYTLWPESPKQKG